MSEIQLKLTIYDHKAEIELPAYFDTLLKILTCLENDYEKVTFKNDKMILYNNEEDLNQENFTERNCS